MIKNYVKTALRNILRHRGYAFINVAGLALGLAACLLIMLLVMDELSYDRFHAHAGHLYRVEQDQNYSGRMYHVNVTPYPMAEGLMAEIPEVEAATPLARPGTLLMRYGEKVFFEGDALAVLPSFLTMFSFPLLRGEAEVVLSEPHSLVISEEIAEKYFGDEDPMGKVVTLNNRFEFTVTGVLENIPTNTVIQCDMLVPFAFLPELGQTIDQWGWNSILTFVQLHENAVMAEVNDKISDLQHRKVMEILQDSPEDLQRFSQRPRTEFMVAPLTGIHLHSYFGYERSPGDIVYVYVFTVIAFFILFIACINFMNLATARSANRAKEVGLRKVVGAVKGNLIWQFYGEALLLSCISLCFALLLVMLLLTPFNTYTGKELSADHLLSFKFLMGMCAVTLLTAFISGSYPALFLSAFKPVQVLKGGLSTGSRGSVFRKALVVLQFALSIWLIISTAVVYTQLKYMHTMKLGYNKDNLIYIQLRGDTRVSYEVFKKELLGDARVVNVTGTNHVPTNIGSNSGGADWDGKDPDMSVLISFNAVGFDYVETMGIEMLEGRSFSRAFSTDTATAFLVNEEVVKIMEVESALNKRFEFLGVEGIIIGVMKNYHFQPARVKIEPLALQVRPDQVNYVVIRLNPDDIDAGVDYVRSTWASVIPNYPFEYQFVDADFDRMYRTESRLSELLGYCSALAIIIACLGLFGLASYTAEQRTKEIGVRKVLGATVQSIVLLLSKEFTRWVAVATIVAWPLAYFLMKSYLQNFAYRTGLQWWIFVLAGVFALLVSLLTVSSQAVRAALANPADALKYE